MDLDLDFDGAADEHLGHWRFPPKKEGLSVAPLAGGACEKFGPQTE